MFKLIRDILITTAVISLGVFVYSNYIQVPVIPLETQIDEMSLGSAITTILGTDKLSNSRTTINDNFASLNAGKVENSTTTLPLITSLINLISIGTIGTGTWEATDIGVEYGGTGASTLADNQILLGNGTGAIDKVSGFGTSGQFLTSNGNGVAPTFQTSAIDLGLDYHWTGFHIFDDALIASSTIDTLFGTDITITNLTVTGTKTGIASTTDVIIFTSDGTWTKLAGAKSVCVQAWGGGGGGGDATDSGGNSAGGGGGGGAYKEFCFNPDDLGATESVVAGTGGLAGVVGESSSFDSLIAYGGGAGLDSPDDSSSGGGGGGGSHEVGVNSTQANPTGGGGAGGGLGGSAVGVDNVSFGGAGGGNAGGVAGGEAIYGGGGAGGGHRAGNGGGGGKSMWGGGGGGGGGSSSGGGAGVSIFGGNGGAGGGSDTNGTAGTIPAGGGGGAGQVAIGTSTGGAGADGQVIVITHF